MILILTIGITGMGALLAMVGSYQVATTVDCWSIWPKAEAVVVRNEFRTIHTRNGSAPILWQGH
jgi:hypothetical protein